MRVIWMLKTFHAQNSLPVSKGTFQFSTRDKAVDSHLRLCRSWENFISPNLLGHSWEIGMYLLRLVKNFQLLHSQLWPSYGGIIPFSKIGGEIANQLLRHVGNFLFLHIKMMVLSFLCKLLAWLLPKSATRSCCGAMTPTNYLWFCTKIPNFWGNTAYLRFGDNLNLG